MKKILLAAVAIVGLPLAAHAQCASGFTQLMNTYACQANATTVFSAANAAAETGWQGYSLREPIPIALISNPGFTVGHVRVSFTVASTTSAGAIDAAYIGTGISSPAYDFAATPVQLTFNGGATNVTGLNGAQTVVSDFVPFTFNFSTAVSMLVSLHFSGTAMDTGKTAQASGTHYYLLQAVGTEGQTAPTGTWSSDGLYSTTVALVEVAP